MLRWVIQMLTMLSHQNLANIVDIAPLGLDDLSDLRYVHATAFRLQARAYLRPEEIRAFTDFVYSQDYLNKLAGEDLHAAWLGTELVGTAGWAATNHNGSLARIRSVFVRPLFGGAGIGRRLVREAEARALEAGFKGLSVRAPVNSVGFFQRMGFETKSHGVYSLSPVHNIPVRFMHNSAARNSADTTVGAERNSAGRNNAGHDKTGKTGAENRRSPASGIDESNAADGLAGLTGPAN